MRQVLFTLPIFGGLKLFGFGTMLVVAFVSSSWLAYWRARREKLYPEEVAEFEFWLRGCFIASKTGAMISRLSGTWCNTGKAESSFTEGSSAGFQRSWCTAGFIPFPSGRIWTWLRHRSRSGRSSAG
jgi:hypothetical protein